MHVSVPKVAGGDVPAQIRTRGSGIVPRRAYLMPRDFSKHGFCQGCPGCIYAQNGIGPKRNHSEDCRRIVEEEIGKDNSDNRADKLKERQDHFMAQHVEQNERVEDPQEENVIEPENVDEEMSGADEEEFTDAPATKSDVRLKSPERKKATKRSTARHEEEPSIKRNTIEDIAMEIMMESMSTRWPLEKKISLYFITPS